MEAVFCADAELRACWIDSIGRRIDDERHQVRFTSRRKGGVWSAVNVAKITELTAAGMMQAGRTVPPLSPKRPRTATNRGRREVS